MDVRTTAGDVYLLNNELLVYGDNGIELRLTARNMATVRQVKRTLDCVKDTDAKDRRFTVAFNESLKSYRFEPTRGSMVRVSEAAMAKALG